MKQYRVYIDDDFSVGDYMVCWADNKTEARKLGRLYIKQWKLINGKIIKITEHVADEKTGRVNK